MDNSVAQEAPGPSEYTLLEDCEDTLAGIIDLLVKNPEAAEVRGQWMDPEGRHLLLAITVDPQDSGLVLGAGGSMIKSIRALFNVVAFRQGLDRITLDLAPHLQRPRRYPRLAHSK